MKFETYIIQTRCKINLWPKIKMIWKWTSNDCKTPVMNVHFFYSMIKLKHFHSVVCREESSSNIQNAHSSNFSGIFFFFFFFNNQMHNFSQTRRYFIIEYKIIFCQITIKPSFMRITIIFLQFLHISNNTIFIWFRIIWIMNNFNLWIVVRLICIFEQFSSIE
jgi:hypothetical protein